MAVTIHSDEFVQALNQFSNQLMQNLSRAMQLACIEVKNKATEKCPSPQSTGHLRQSLTYNVKQDGNSVLGAVGSTAEYAIYVHEGTGIYSRTGVGRQTPWVYHTDDDHFYTTSGNEAQPFLEEAANESYDRIGQIFQATISGGGNG